MPLSIFGDENANLLKVKRPRCQPAMLKFQPSLSNPLHYRRHQSIKKDVDKKQKKRNKVPIRKQFKVRLIEKPLSHTTKPEDIVTTATATQTLMMKPRATSTKWPTVKLTPIPLTIYNVPSVKIQEVPSYSMQKPQGEEGPLIPYCNNLLMEQQPTSLQPKASGTATSAIHPMRDATP